MRRFVLAFRASRLSPEAIEAVERYKPRASMYRDVPIGRKRRARYNQERLATVDRSAGLQDCIDGHACLVTGWFRDRPPRNPPQSGAITTISVTVDA